MKMTSFEVVWSGFRPTGFYRYYAYSWPERVVALFRGQWGIFWTGRRLEFVPKNIKIVGQVLYSCNLTVGDIPDAAEDD